MEFFRDTRIDFLKSRRVFVVVSSVLVAVSIAPAFIGGQLNLGIDFAGGTQLNRKFDERPAVEELRSIVAELPDDTEARYSQKGYIVNDALRFSMSTRSEVGS